MPNESRFALRLPTELYDAIRNESQKEGMSINEYIVFVLGDYHNLNNEVERRLAAIEARLRETDPAFAALSPKSAP